MLPTASGLERYEVLRELFTSTCGATYKAMVRDRQELVALRTICPGPFTNPSLPAILHTAKDSLELDSPYIARVSNAFEASGMVLMVMDYVEGAGLAAALGTSHLSEWDISDLSRQVCSAIDHATSKNVFHQNLHPGNIVQEWDGTVKVLDYGVTTNALARARSTGAPAAVHYLSPEQVRGSEPDQRSNIFSYGAIMYELITGTKAFPGPDVSKILTHILDSTPVAPHLIKAGVNPGLSRIILKALAKSPEERYQSGAALLHDLDHHKDKVTLAPKIAVPVTDRVAVPVASLPSNRIALSPQVPPSKPEHTESRPISVKATPIFPKKAPKATVPEPPPTKPPEQPLPSTAEDVPALPLKATPLTPTPRSQFLIVGPKTNPEPQDPVPDPQELREKLQSRPVERKKRSHIGLFIAIGLGLLVLALAVFAVLFFRYRHTPEASSQTAPVQQAVPSTVEQPAVPDAQIPQAIPDDSATRNKKKNKTTSATPVAAAPMLGNVTVSSVPAGAVIEIDGQQNQYVTPHTAPGLSPGSHTVRIFKAGYEPVTRSVFIQPGMTANLSVSLSELRATVLINSNPDGALVAVNGERSSRTTPVTVMLLKGKYTIALSKQGFLPTETTIDVTPGQNYRVAPHLAPLGNAEDVREVGRLKKLFGGGSEMGKVQFRTAPKGAQVSVNGRIMKKQTPMDLFFPSGHYEIVVTLPGYKRAQRNITVTENTTQTVDVQLERESK